MCTCLSARENADAADTYPVTSQTFKQILSCFSTASSASSAVSALPQFWSTIMPVECNPTRIDAAPDVALAVAVAAMGHYQVRSCVDNSKSQGAELIDRIERDVI